MELLIPSLVGLLIAVAFAYFVMPRFAPTILVTASSVVLVAAIYMHAKQFGVSEYERATWIYKIKDYFGYVIFGTVLIGAYGFYAMNNIELPSSVKNMVPNMPSMPSMPSMPAISMPTIGGGGGMDAIAKTVTSRIGQLIRKGRITLE
jgi:hypothetical protein